MKKSYNTKLVQTPSYQLTNLKQPPQKYSFRRGKGKEGGIGVDFLQNPEGYRALDPQLLPSSQRAWDLKQAMVSSFASFINSVVEDMISVSQFTC
jgi:hypothetical protein